MALCHLNYYSNALGKQTAAYVLLPEVGNGPFSVMYLFHGLSDDYTIWLRRTSIERYVAHLPLMVVMPDSGRGFYCDAVQGFQYDAALGVELVDRIDRTFPTKATRAGRCTTGLSMGGYGALKLALAHPDRFCSAVSHSGAVAFGHKVMQHRPEAISEWERILGQEQMSGGGPNDLYRLATETPPETLPTMRIDCGVDDFLIDDNRAFHAFLDEQQVPHEYAEYPGAHTWEYWDEHVQEAIAFHRPALGI